MSCKLIYERIFDDSWHKVRIFNIESDIYREVAEKVINELERQKII